MEELINIELFNIDENSYSNINENDNINSKKIIKNHIKDILFYVFKYIALVIIYVIYILLNLYIYLKYKNITFISIISNEIKDRFVDKSQFEKYMMTIVIKFYINLCKESIKQELFRNNVYLLLSVFRVIIKYIYEPKVQIICNTISHNLYYLDNVNVIHHINPMYPDPYNVSILCSKCTFPFFIKNSIKRIMNELSNCFICEEPNIFTNIDNTFRYEKTQYKIYNMTSIMNIFCTIRMVEDRISNEIIKKCQPQSISEYYNNMLNDFKFFNDKIILQYPSIIYSDINSVIINHYCMRNINNNNNNLNIKYCNNYIINKINKHLIIGICPENIDKKLIEDLGYYSMILNLIKDSKNYLNIKDIILHKTGLRINNGIKQFTDLNRLTDENACLFICDGESLYIKSEQSLKKNSITNFYTIDKDGILVNKKTIVISLLTLFFIVNLLVLIIGLKYSDIYNNANVDPTSATSLSLVVSGLLLTLIKSINIKDWLWYDFIRMRYRDNNIFNKTQINKNIKMADFIKYIKSRKFIYN
jgi:hypothetical protein